MASPSLAQSMSPNPNHPGGRPEHDLTSFFLNAKRSLESKDLIFRAAELVSSTKTALENAATLLPKCVYLRNALEGSLTALRSLNGAMTQTKKNFVGIVQVRKLTALSCGRMQARHLKQPSPVETGD